MATLLLLPLGAGGCGTEEEVGAPVPVDVHKAKAKKDTESTAEDTEGQVFTYNAIGKRDPFRNYFAEIETEDEGTRKLTELQRYDLDQLNIVAVIVGMATPKALIEDPTGEGHVVKVGTLIGKHWGQVKHIRRGEVIVQEEFRDFTGRRVTHLVPMKLPEDESGRAGRGRLGKGRR